MSSLFHRIRKPPRAVCFYCSTDLEPQPPDPCNFVCPQCSCRNRYDRDGTIIGDEPAMHEEELNHKSYAVRASPSKSTIPNLSTTNPLCQTCRTNHMLHVNLLANYLPAPSDPSYNERLKQLPDYRRSLELRYPTVCAECAPAVEDALQRKDDMARAAAIGKWIARTKEDSDTRRKSASLTKPGFFSRWQTRLQDGPLAILVWRIQAVLWSITTALSLMASALGSRVFSEYHAPFRIRCFKELAILFTVSILWTNWDPTFGAAQKARMRKQNVVFTRRRAWTISQYLLWILRTGNASFLAWMGGPHDPIISDGVFAAEVLLLAVSLWSIRFERQEKARIRLAATRPLLSRPSASLGEVDFLAPLSLSNQPPIPNDLSRLMSESNPLGRSSSLPASFPTSPNGFPLRMGGPPEPVFGQTSLSSSQPPPAQYLLGPSEPQDEMEWDPTPSHTPLDDSWIRPQTFFPREEPTGLENLFDGWNWLEDNTSASRGVLRSKAEAMRKDGSGQGSRIWNWLGWK